MCSKWGVQLIRNDRFKMAEICSRCSASSLAVVEGGPAPLGGVLHGALPKTSLEGVMHKGQRVTPRVYRVLRVALAFVDECCM